jgi:hypothetical protein
MQRLSIVVPYRAREAHLKKFVPHLRAYFARDKLDCAIPYRVLIVEQDSALPFNRGALENVGFLLGRAESDYTCFHDVDYLPVWADYRPVDVPTPILWHGAEVRPIAPGRSNQVIRSDMEHCFGGVVLFPNEMFAQINGYANRYWGWGFADTDLQHRVKAAGMATGRRKGTFTALDHDHEGYRLDGSKSPIGRVNERIFAKRWEAGATDVPRDGLDTVAYEVLSRKEVPEGRVVERAASWEIVTVRFRMQPDPEQLAAVASAGTSPS